MSERKIPKVRKSESPEDKKKSEVGGQKSEEENKSEIENPKSEIKSLPTVNLKLQTETMEVHHHPQLEHKAKPWKEYLLEGLMIFLAVTMGFFAESIRENIGDHSKEKAYIVSLKNDLETDTANLTKLVRQQRNQVSRIDSLIHLLNKPLLTEIEKNDAYYYARMATRMSSFYTTDRTLIQLKSSGTFRLIRNQLLITRLLDYEQLDDRYLFNFSVDRMEREHVYGFDAKIFDANVFQAMVDSINVIHRPTGLHAIKTIDKDLINEFIYYLHQMKTTFLTERMLCDNMKKSATSMISLIKNDYSE